ncbi:uncharacterized protein LOC111454115 [Cucurbita moschata]|uniref:Uncharacterized protein LOC111454115 n=1 Tax=Cucurbita moschata TaxID=3662 RepID=A0A6J1GGX5_CUCMO|nr:uncharacterized protein LOC111454115 [Cucurbita moschata]
MHEECVDGNFSSIEMLSQSSLPRVARSHVSQLLSFISHFFRNYWRLQRRLNLLVSITHLKWLLWTALYLLKAMVFISSYTGNMATTVECHRRFLGNRRTIPPDRQEICKEEEEAFYVNPLPNCLCQREQSNSQTTIEY